MFGLFKPKKKQKITKEQSKKRIEKEVQSFSSLKPGITAQCKEGDSEFFYINIIIEKITVGAEKSKIPDQLVFLIVLDYFYPENNPKILAKTNFYTPSLMDGRDLLFDIYPNYTHETKLFEIANELPNFLAKVINSLGYKFYGKFHLGAKYELGNFDNMLVNKFNCKLLESSASDKDPLPKSLKTTCDYLLVLSGDALLLFEIISKTIGKIAFWGSLYSISFAKFNKMEKKVNLDFYDNDSTNEYHLRLSIDNILFFRDTLVKKMKGLRVKVESSKLLKGKNYTRLSMKEIHTMEIDDIEKNVEELKEIIKSGEINDYTVKTFTTLCGKAIEHYAMKGDEKHLKYLDIMKEILHMEAVEKLTVEDQKEIEEGVKESQS